MLCCCQLTVRAQGNPPVMVAENATGAEIA